MKVTIVTCEWSSTEEETGICPAWKLEQRIKYF